MNKNTKASIGQQELARRVLDTAHLNNQQQQAVPHPSFSVNPSKPATSHHNSFSHALLPRRWEQCVSRLQEEGSKQCKMSQVSAI